MHAASRKPNRTSAAYPHDPVRKLSGFIGFLLYLMPGHARCIFTRASCLASSGPRSLQRLRPGCLEWGHIKAEGVIVMPIATPEVYAQMLDTAKQRGFAFPAINVTSSQTLNAALRGFAEAGSDGIVQISTGGAEYLSGSVKDMVTGAVALVEFAHVAA